MHQMRRAVAFMNPKWLIRVLYFFNFLFATSGLALIILGGTIHGKFAPHQSVTGDSLSAAAVVIIFVGIIIFGIAILGCVSTKKESAQMLFIYLGILGSIILTEFAIGIAGYALRGTILKKIKDQIEQDMNTYPNNSDTLDNLQERFHCCGSCGPASWLNTTFGAQKNGTYPKSCCIDDCKNGTVFDNTTMYQNGCVNALSHWASDHAAIFGAILIIFACFELIGVLITLFTSIKVRNFPFSEFSS